MPRDGRCSVREPATRQRAAGAPPGFLASRPTPAAAVRACAGAQVCLRARTGRAPTVGAWPVGLVGYRSICRSRNSSDAPSSSTATSSLRRSVPSSPVQVRVTRVPVTLAQAGRDPLGLLTPHGGVQEGGRGVDPLALGGAPPRVDRQPQLRDGPRGGGVAQFGLGGQVGGGVEADLVHRGPPGGV